MLAGAEQPLDFALSTPCLTPFFSLFNEGLILPAALWRAALSSARTEEPVRGLPEPRHGKHTCVVVFLCLSAGSQADLMQGGY